MIIQRGFKTEFELNNRQRTLCRKHAGCARFAYNWGLRRKIETYKLTGKAPNAMELHRELNQLKLGEFSWMYEVSKCAPQESLRNLDKAFEHFYRRLKNGQKPGFPKFKSKKQGLGSFRLTGKIRVFEHFIQLPRLGRIKLKEQGYLPSKSNRVHILSATISEKAGRWFVSLQVREEISVPKNVGPIVGVDLGINRLATISDGSVIENPKALKRYGRKLKRFQRYLARKQKGSRNWEKAKRRLQRLHVQVTNIRRDVLHKTTTMLAKTKSIIVIEELNMSGMLKNHRLARSLADVAFFTFRSQLEYKTKWYGSQLIIAPRFYPSSRCCSKCGNIKEKFSLSTRIFRCEKCGLLIDRGMNASYNLETVTTSSMETENAWSETGGNSLLAVPVDETGTEQRIIQFS